MDFKLYEDVAPIEDAIPNDAVIPLVVMPLVVPLLVDCVTLAVSSAESAVDWSPLRSCSSVGAWFSIFCD